MNRQRVRLSLHIKHPARDLSGVCRAIGLEPKHIWKRGDERQTPKGRKLGGLRESSYCSIDLGFSLGLSERERLPEQIEAALTLLRPHEPMLRELSSAGGRISFYVGWFCDEDTGETLGVQLMESMARMGIALDLLIYFPDPPELESEADAAD